MGNSKGLFSNPNAMDRLAGLGAILSGLDQGRVADVSGYSQNIQDRNAHSELMSNEDILSRFTPEQRKILADMPPLAAQQLIQQTLFAQPDPLKQLQVQREQIGLDRDKLALEQMRNPQAGAPDIETINGQSATWNPQTGQFEAVQGFERDQEKYRQLTPDEVAARGLDPSKQWQVAPDNNIKQIGGGGTNINNYASGPNAPTVGREAVDKAYAQDYVDWTQGGNSNMAGNLAQLDSVIKEIDSGANLSGPVLGNLPDALATITNPKAVAMRERVEQVVQDSLKAILGAAFGEKEGERLIKRAYNPKLEESENAARLRRLSATMKSAFEARNAQAQYFQENGTLTGYQGPRISVKDFERALDGRTSLPNISQASATDIADYMQDNPIETWSQEDRAAILKRLDELKKGAGNGN